MDEKKLLRLIDTAYKTGFYAATMERATLTKTEHDYYANEHLKAINLRNRLKGELLNDSTKD
jgi:hypothetical protein